MAIRKGLSLKLKETSYLTYEMVLFIENEISVENNMVSFLVR